MLRIWNCVIFGIFFVDWNIVVGVVVIPWCDTFVHSLFSHVAILEVYFVLLRQNIIFWIFEIYVFYFHFIFHVLRWNVFSYILLLLRLDDSIIKNFHLFIPILLLITVSARDFKLIRDLTLNGIKIKVNLFFLYLIWKYWESLRRSNFWFILIV
jgi:hypothetical protein